MRTAMPQRHDEGYMHNLEPVSTNVFATCLVHMLSIYYFVQEGLQKAWLEREGGVTVYLADRCPVVL